METELADLDGLKKMTATAAEGYAGMALEFEFGWDKTKTLADVRDRMNRAEAKFPDGADKYLINEINFSEFPIIIVNLTGALPERELVRAAKALQDRLEAMDAVLEAKLSGHRDEMVEVVIDPLKMEAYNITAGELISAVRNNNQLIAAGEIETETGAFSVKIPASFDSREDIYALPVKGQGDRQVLLGDLADIRLTFEDPQSTARYNGNRTVALQVVKRKGFNVIETAEQVREEVKRVEAGWPEPLRAAISIGTSNDQSYIVDSMVSQLENSVLTAIALVMIVVLGALGTRSALLVGFAIPTSFLLTFALLAVMGVAVSNIVMFGLILAVGMLVDGAIVVVEYADKRIQEGIGPMHAYVEAAKRMFWPIVSSTATTLCAFLPMLFWPGVPGEFMGMLPVTLIFVLSASLLVALVYLPVMGGVAGRISRRINHASEALRRLLPVWILRAALLVVTLALTFLGALQLLNPSYLFAAPAPPTMPWLRYLPGAALFLAGAMLNSVVLGALRIERKPRRVQFGTHHTLFGHLIKLVAANPVMPLVTVAAVIAFVVATFAYYGKHNLGVEFFVDTEPDQAIIYVRGRGNLSLAEKDAMVREVERVVLDDPAVASVFAFAGSGRLNQNTGGAQAPRDTVGQVNLELVRWEDRPRSTRKAWFLGLIPYEVIEIDPFYNGKATLARIAARLERLPGIRTEILNLSRGPASGKPVHLRLKGEDWAALVEATQIVEAKFAQTEGLVGIEDTLPLPGIDWQVDVDVDKAGRFGADVATVGGMVQLVTRGLLLDTMRVPSADEEIEIRVRVPKKDRVLSTLQTLKVRTALGLVPLSQFVTIRPVSKLAQIDRVDQQRFFDVKADVVEGLTRSLTAADGSTRVVPINANERIGVLTEWLQNEAPLPEGVVWEWAGDREEQAESQAFLQSAFLGALGLMFIILLAQFNSFYHSVLVLLAVVLSTAGVLIGMLVMHQPFSIIMTGTGVVALAGIVVNNNIVLIDTYHEFSRYMPRIEAIVRTAEARLRPVFLTTITTIAGLTPMMLGLSLDFINGGYALNAPTALWWKQLATAVVFGLGIATVLTLVFTPAMLAIPVWIQSYAAALARLTARLTLGRSSRIARDHRLARAAHAAQAPEIVWDTALPAFPAASPEEEELSPEDEEEQRMDDTSDNPDAALLRMLSTRAAE
ncbi:MAG: efflux RND transporter permease subunit, partial [Alphaproteobacteria bacterium]